MLNVKLFLTQHKERLVLAVALGFYLVITLPALFDSNHVLKNLEPYPDGLVYALSARNFALGKGLALVSNQDVLAIWVPPLYSLYLSLFYIFSQSPTNFYVANIILGLSTITLLFLTIKNTTRSFFSLIVGLAIYFSHLIIFWLPSLAMSENLSLLLFTLMVYGLLAHQGLRKIAIVAFSAAALLLVKFSVFPIALTGALLAAVQTKDSLLKYKKQLLGIGIAVLLVVLVVAGLAQLDVLLQTISGSLASSQFFGTQFILLNLAQYLLFMFANQGRYLWQPLGITSWPILAAFAYFLYHSLLKKRTSGGVVLLALLISLFPLQLVFYEVDARFFVYAIILFSLAAATITDSEKSKKTLTMLLLLAAGVNVMYQAKFARELIGSNLLHRSTAWQYEAVEHFNAHLHSGDIIITALPPFFVDAYQSSNYVALPLSSSQEFLQKRELVWGDIDYNLISGYKNMLKDGQTLYITNSYVTHQQSVTDDFETFKREFKLRTVAPGCNDTCTIYEITL